MFRPTQKDRQLPHNFLKTDKLQNSTPEDISLAAITKVHYLPYLEHSNFSFASSPNEVAELSGYQKNRFLYQYTKKEIQKSSADRFNFIFQNNLINKNHAFKTFFLGNSLAYGFGVAKENKYYTLLQKEYENTNIQIIPSAVSAINSTQENILLHTTILPNSPQLVFIINGWNDIAMPPIFGVRPGDPMTMSSLYCKYESTIFNFLLKVSKKSKIISRWITNNIIKDRNDYLALLLNDKDFQICLKDSIINILMSNLEIMIESCSKRNISVIHMLQPSADLNWKRYKFKNSAESQISFSTRMQKYPWASLNLGGFIAEMYEAAIQEIRKKKWSSCSYDIQDWFNLDDFLDPVHLNESGHKKMSNALKEIINTQSNLRLSISNNQTKEIA